MRFARSAYVGVVLAVPLALGAWVLPSASGPAGAASPTITVAPDTALVSRQTVTVTGSGFVAGDRVELVQCEAGTKNCNFIDGRLVITDSSGAFSSPFTVARGLDLGPVFDCGAAPATCEILAYSLAGDGQAVAPLAFDGSVGVPVPSAVVTPSVDLADREVVTVDASGFEPTEQVSVAQCFADGLECGFFSPTVLLTADANGEVHTTVRVHRAIPGALPEATNCAAAVGTCIVRVAARMEPLSHADVLLGFDPAAVVPSDATMTIVPAGPWVDGQSVTLSGAGFSHKAELGIAECVAAGDTGAAGCDRSIFDAIYTDDAGAFSLTFTITRTLDPPYGPPVDCVTVEGGCLLLAANRMDWVERVAIPIEFVQPIVPAFTG